MPLWADAIQMSGIWYTDVDVLDVKKGYMHYVINATGSRGAQPVGEIQSMRLDRYPDLATATEFIKAGQDQKAIKLLAMVRKSARGRDSWVAHEAGKQLVFALDRLGKGADAAAAYLELVAQGADAVYLKQPPLASVAAMPHEARANLKSSIERALRRASPNTKPWIKRLLAVTAVAVPEPPKSPSSTAILSQAVGAPVSQGGTYPVDATVLLPANLTRNPVGDLLVAGQFKKAIVAADHQLHARVSSDVLYQKAMARLAIAQRSKAADAYKDAGLEFMRVVVYFPTSRYVGPSLLEVAYVHEQLGLKDQAAELYEQARAALDPEDDPRYYKRYEQLTGSAAGH